MRKYLHIDIGRREIREEVFEGEQIVFAGRCFIARTLLEAGAARVDPLGPDNPLIFSAGPFAGTSWSNANRTSVGCRSPLTGGVKEANGGGSFSLALGQLGMAGFTLTGASQDWLVLHLRRDGSIGWDDADGLLGLGNNDCARRLHERYGNKVSLAICGPVGEYQGLLSGIAFSDTDRRPSRLAARGGVGAVMGSKRVKAIVVDLDRMPEFLDRRAVMKAVKQYGRQVREDEFIDNYRQNGTAIMADYTNMVGGLPVNNFTSGRQVDTDRGELRMGGSYIRKQNIERGGQHAHACMPGCLIECSNVYVDEAGKEIVSPVEYETLGLLGTNCGLDDPDQLARLNAIANDLGIDTIETGAMLAVLMDAGLAAFGDYDFMVAALEEIRLGSDNGRLWAQGTGRVGRHYGVARVPTIKDQAISAYDPRVIEVTGISMMVTAQGADHTTGNAPTYKSQDKPLDELVDVSMKTQILFAASDSLGLCVFGRSVTNTNVEFITDTIEAAYGVRLAPDWFDRLGRDTLRYEDAFNREAGFDVSDDELPAFFYDEALPPSDKVARFHAPQVREAVARWWQQNP